METDAVELPNTTGSKVKLALVNTVGGLAVGYGSAIIAGAQPGIISDWGELSELYQGLITASIVLGTALGSLTGGVLADKIGRQKSLIAVGLGMVVFTVAEACSYNVPMLLLIRLILGYFIGVASAVCPLYVAEMSPSNIRGRLGSLFQVSVTFGIVLAYLFGFFLGPHRYPFHPLGWRIMFGIGAVPAVALLYIAFFLMEESALWLDRSIKDKDRTPLLSSTTGSFAGPFNPEAAVGWSGLFSKQCLLPLSIGIVLAFDLQGTGINGIIYYLPKLLTSAGLGDLASLLTIVVGIWNFLSTFFALFLVDRLGRKPLLIVGTCIMAISLASVGIAFYALEGKVRAWFAFSAIMLFHTGFEIGPGVLFWIIVAEIFPNGVRSEANGFINLLANSINLAVCLLFPIVFKAAGGGTFFFFCAMAILSAGYALFFYKDSRDDSPLMMLTIQEGQLM